MLKISCFRQKAVNWPQGSRIWQPFFYMYSTVINSLEYKKSSDASVTKSALTEMQTKHDSLCTQPMPMTTEICGGLYWRARLGATTHGKIKIQVRLQGGILVAVLVREHFLQQEEDKQADDYPQALGRVVVLFTSWKGSRQTVNMWAGGLYWSGGATNNSPSARDFNKIHCFKQCLENLY